MTFTDTAMAPANRPVLIIDNDTSFEPPGSRVKPVKIKEAFDFDGTLVRVPYMLYGNGWKKKMNPEKKCRLKLMTLP